MGEVCMYILCSPKTPSGNANKAATNLCFLWKLASLGCPFRESENTESACMGTTLTPLNTTLSFKGSLGISELLAFTEVQIHSTHHKKKMYDFLMNNKGLVVI